MDQQLDQALREWEIKADLPPRFQERVWQRIARPEVNLWGALTAWIDQALKRPVLAVSYLTLLLAAGVVAGQWQARSERAHTMETLRVRYVQMVDPYRLPRH